MTSTVTWVGIFFCLTQSAMLSGLNLALFSLSKLELELEALKGNRRAQRIKELRSNTNLTLVTILWGNVGVNVILALLSGSVLNGIAAFLFSTVVITVFAEIIPQSYFTRHALRMGSLLSPLLRVYQILLYPVAKPTALMLDIWLGGENIRYFREPDLRKIIRLHMEASESDIAWVEGQGALNFLEIDDVPLDDEGEPLDPDSIVQLEFKGERPVFPSITPAIDDTFLLALNRSGKSWVIVVDSNKEPKLVIRAQDFIREALFKNDTFKPFRHCHRPIVVRDPKEKLGELIQRFRVLPRHAGDDILDDDIILLWNKNPRIVTADDILGRLLRGIARQPQHANLPETVAGR